MKNQKKITRVKLQIDEADEFLIFGLVSSEPDYRLSLQLKQNLGLTFKNIPPVSISGDDNDEIQFSRFKAIDNHSDRIYILVSNRTGKQFLIRRMKNIDYLFLIHDPDETADSGKVIASLKAVPGITAVFNADADMIRERKPEFLIQ